jgi:rfaE bifunctional protein nucleotidyltransferase chain/domain
VTAAEPKKKTKALTSARERQNHPDREKVVSVDALAEIVRELKEQGRRIIFANGCFDILHVGHIRYLTEARALGDVLIVAVNDDTSARTLKGADRPWMNQDDRLEILSALSCVDYLVLFGDKDVSRLLRLFKPDVHAKGTDYTIETVPERDVVQEYGGQTAITGDPKTRSSTGFATRVRSGPSGTTGKN